ncbi:sulfurtransferase [Mesoterricola sediminis]|uniref:Thiosulfate sulfurtransferase n=1 Tax=Mesoterricola sediminis TaxID=2927980 RepID=A0AA48H0Q9_9BACT|nr:sulfurtransferase [Mesoterricola sediminis]BDU77507.1 thiosulfate sulfurtransferase [Mesoterricola sediminis]
MSRPALVAPQDLTAPFVLMDCRAGAGTFAAGHLPGAIHADLDRFLGAGLEPGADPARGGRHPLPDPAAWARQLGAWGIVPGTWVVAYDGASGGAGAARLWWMLRAFGHEDVSVLDGGMAAALEAGLPAPGVQPPPAPDYPEDRWLLPRADIDLVDRLRLDPDWKILDVRAPERYRGETEPLDPVAGHIPGALNLPWQRNLGPDGRMKPARELRELYQAFLGDTPRQRLVVHCGSGVTACHTLLALEAAGLGGAALYVGSWSEWCRSGRERATGA